MSLSEILPKNAVAKIGAHKFKRQRDEHYVDEAVGAATDYSTRKAFFGRFGIHLAAGAE